MAMTPFQTLDIERAHDTGAAYALLRQTLAGDLSLFVADKEAGFDIGSDEAQSIIGDAGFRQGDRTYSLSFGEGGRDVSLGFHSDGWPGSKLVEGIHMHETPAGVARATFIPMLRKVPFLSKHVDWEHQKINSEYLEPRAYQTVLGLGTVAVFAVDGRNALAHLFETLPDHVAYREAVVNEFDRF